MFNPTLIVVESFVGELRTMYDRNYGKLDPAYPISLVSSAGWRLRISQPAMRLITMSITLLW